MITKIEMDGKKVLAISIPSVTNMGDVRELRAALMDMVETCVASDESKDNTPCMAIYFVMQMIRELTSDIEKGGHDGSSD